MAMVVVMDDSGGCRWQVSGSSGTQIVINKWFWVQVGGGWKSW